MKEARSLESNVWKRVRVSGKNSKVGRAVEFNKLGPLITHSRSLVTCSGFHVLNANCPDSILYLDRLEHRIRKVVKVSRGDPSDIDASASNDVDSSLIFEPIDLHRSKSAEGKHAVLLQKE